MTAPVPITVLVTDPAAISAVAIVPFSIAPVSTLPSGRYPDASEIYIFVVPVAVAVPYPSRYLALTSAAPVFNPAAFKNGTCPENTI